MEYAHLKKQSFSDNIYYQSRTKGFDPAEIEKDYYMRLMVKQLLSCLPDTIFGGQYMIEKYTRGITKARTINLSERQDLSTGAILALFNLLQTKSERDWKLLFSFPDIKIADNWIKGHLWYNSVINHHQEYISVCVHKKRNFGGDTTDISEMEKDNPALTLQSKDQNPILSPQEQKLLAAFLAQLLKSPAANHVITPAQISKAAATFTKYATPVTTKQFSKILASPLFNQIITEHNAFHSHQENQDLPSPTHHTPPIQQIPGDNFGAKKPLDIFAPAPLHKNITPDKRLNKCWMKKEEQPKER